jgi:hypothetical protein
MKIHYLIFLNSGLMKMNAEKELEGKLLFFPLNAK